MLLSSDSSTATSLDDIPDRIRRMGEVLHREAAAKDMAAAFETRLAAVRAKGFVDADPNEFATHTFRATGATLLRRAGYSHLFVRAMGRWRSDCYKQYMHLATGVVSRVASHMFSGVRISECPMRSVGG